jgi:hypothetical protein
LDADGGALPLQSAADKAGHAPCTAKKITERFLISISRQPVGLEESQRKSDLVRTNIEDFEGQNSYSTGRKSGEI